MSLAGWLTLAPPLLAAAGAGLLTHVVLSAMADLFRYGLGSRRRDTAWTRDLLILERLLGGEEEGPTVLSEDELYGITDVAPYMPVAALLGLGLSWTLFGGVMRYLGAAAGLVPILWKRRRLEDARQEARRQIADLIVEMRLRLVFSGSLGAALVDLAGEESLEGVVYDRLRAHQDLIRFSRPEDLMERLIEEFGEAASELRTLLVRLRAAQQGGGAYAEALRKAAEAATEEVYRRAEVQIEAAPVRVLFPMLLFLFTPVIVLVVYPLAAQLLRSITVGSLP